MLAPRYCRYALITLLIAAAFSSGCMMQRHQQMMAPREARPVVTPAPTATPGGSATVSFSRDVRPLLVSRCAACHGGLLGLYVDSYETLMAGSSRTGVVRPGNPEESVLIRRVRGEIEPRMPLGLARLSEEEIALLETWIREGAANN